MYSTEMIYPQKHGVLRVLKSNLNQTLNTKNRNRQTYKVRIIRKDPIMIEMKIKIKYAKERIE